MKALFKKKYLLLLISLAINIVVAFPNDSITVSSRFENKHFVTYCKIKIDASNTVADKLIDNFIRQNNYHLDSLFTWALKDLKLQGEEGELLEYNLKSTAYNSETDIVHGKMDVRVPGIHTVKDFSVFTRATKSTSKNGDIDMFFEVLDADAFIKTTTAILKVVRIDEKSVWCTLESKMSFGWFFNIFITQKRYKETAEWRFKQLMINLKETAEEAQQAVSNKQ